MAEEAIRFKVTDEGTLKTAANFKALGGSMASANDNYKAFSATAQKGAVTLAAFGGALGQFDSRIAAVGASVGRASGAISAMSSVLGGPWGVAIGLAVTATGLLAQGFKTLQDETDGLAKATIDYNTTLEAQIALLEKASRAASQRQQIAMGVAGPTTQLADVRRLEAAAQQNRYQASITTDRGKAIALDRERVRIEAELAAARGRYGEAESTEAGLRADEGAEFMARERSQKKAAPNDEIFGPQYMGRRTFDNSRFNYQQNMMAFSSNAQKQAADTAIASSQGDLGGMMDETFKQVEELTKQWDMYRDAGVGAMTSIASGGLDALHQLVKGHKVSAKEIVAGIGDQIWAQGQGHLLLGLANAFIPGMQGSSAALVGIGLSEMAIGGVMGAATRGSGASGGGGRSESPLVNSQQGGSGGGNTYITNINALAVSPNADIGMEINKHRREAERQYGSAA